MLKSTRYVTWPAPDLSRLKGPAAILGATCLMALQDALVKWLSGDVPLWQFFLMRSLLILPLLAIFIRRTRPGALHAALTGWVLLRSVLIVAMYVFFYAALPVLELPVVSAVYYTGPVFIVLFSAVVLRERVSATRWLAIATAFAGVLIVLRPGGAAFSAAALVPLASALCYAVAMTTTRGRMGMLDAWALTFALNLAFAAAGLAGIATAAVLDTPATYPFLLTPWQTPAPDTLPLILLLALISIAVHVLLARAYQLGPTAVVAGLDFSYLGFAAIWAGLIFGTVPSGPVVLGSALICAAGLGAILRGRR